MLTKIREPINSISHLLGILLSVVGLILLLVNTIPNGNILQVVAASIFGISLICLYSASTIYHWVISTDKIIRTLRKIDHCMIYVLIAGTYSPVCLLTLKGKLGIGLFIAIWSLALIGMILKMVWLDAPRWLYTSFYLVFGWMAVFFIYPLSKAMPGQGVFLLILGGLFYSAGSIFYMLKPEKLRFLKLGFHEIFHLFILAGSISHYLFVFIYVLG
ncbi:MAG: hemolysin III family protein [Eubacteriales bacterium]